MQAGGLEKPFGRVAYPCCGADDYFDDHPVLLLGRRRIAEPASDVAPGDLIYGLAALIVSNIPFFSLKNNDIKKRHPIWMLVFGFVLITLIIAQMQIMFFTIVLLYTLSGPFLWCLTTYKHRRERKREGAQAMP